MPSSAMTSGLNTACCKKQSSLLPWSEDNPYRKVLSFG
jgi:hypothetical protein